MIDHRLSKVSTDPWAQLKKYTRARIALGKCGASLPTDAMLDFQLCHARARDAVHAQLDFEKTRDAIKKITGDRVLLLKSQVRDGAEYLRRPDLGRKLAAESAKALRAEAKKREPDIALVIADGLSATAIEQNAVPFLEMLIPALNASSYTLAPVSLVEKGRVAVADEIGSILGARLAVMFIGERPGLQSANSMGIYMTYHPEVGTTDEKRNCISNIRPEGLSCSAGVSKLLYLIGESIRRRISGVHLKDRQIDLELDAGSKSLEDPSL